MRIRLALILIITLIEYNGVMKKLKGVEDNKQTRCVAKKLPNYMSELNAFLECRDIVKICYLNMCVIVFLWLYIIQPACFFFFF